MAASDSGYHCTSCHKVFATKICQSCNFPQCNGCMKHDLITDDGKFVMMLKRCKRCHTNQYCPAKVDWYDLKERPTPKKPEETK